MMHDPTLPPSGPTRPGWARRAPLAALLAVLVAGWSALPALAQPSLYGPDAPADVAFLRVVNASAAPVSAGVGDVAVDELLPGEGSDYVPVPAGEARFEVRRGEGAEPEVETPEVGPEAFVTLLVLNDGLRLIEDPVLRDISRGLLVFVNATDEPLTLRVEDGSVAFEAVEGEPASRTIAESAVGFDVVDASGELVGSVERRLFARGVAHTVLAYDGPEGPAVAYLAASLAE